MSLALALPWLSRASVLPWFTSPVLLGVVTGPATTARAQVKGYKGAPPPLYIDRSPRAWATHKHDTLLGQAQNGARAGGAVFTAVKLFARCTSHDTRAMWRVVRDVGVMRGAVSARVRHIAVKRRLAPSS